MYKSANPADAIALVQWLCDQCNAVWVIKAVTLTEWALGSMILFGYLGRTPLVMTAVLLTLFSSVLYAAVYGGFTAGCGCVGIKTSVGAALIRNAALIAMVAVVFWLERPRPDRVARSIP
ncbi:MAG: hypothetical protein HBSAPP03_13930 [Phycisphaerae bacterium]|nr:MAG: hypothetical protein HBSAPP03_13930 [Phycisphaerae bacterium]